MIRLDHDRLHQPTFTGHGSDNYRDRVRYGDMEETVLVYAMTEVGEYRARRAWERV